MGDHWALSGQSKVMSVTAQFNPGYTHGAGSRGNRVRGTRSLSWERGDGGSKTGSICNGDFKGEKFRRIEERCGKWNKRPVYLLSR